MKAEFLKYLDTNCILVLEGTTKKAVLEEIIALATDEPLEDAGHDDITLEE